MPQIIKYVFVAGISAGLVALVSIVWPKLTDSPQPQALQEVRGVALGTKIGRSTAEFFGVADGAMKPINFSDTVSSVAGSVTSSVEQKVAQIVSDQIASQVVKQYQQLPASQQSRVAEMICTPKE